MARFFTIASGSSGNSAYLGGASGGVLVDAGVSCRQLLEGLSTNGVMPEQVRAVLITHEHIDHIRGLKVLMKRLHVPLYASPEVLDYLASGDYIPPGTRLEAIDEAPVEECGMELTAFCTAHDSVRSLGYRVRTADDRTIGVCTDLGHVSEAVRAALTGCDLVLLESNYEHAMLMNGAYPYYLKKRIAGSHGHLSNADCAELLPQLVRGGTTRIVLAHLSRENNVPELAHATSLGALRALGLEPGLDFTLSVAPRSEAATLCTF